MIISKFAKKKILVFFGTFLIHFNILNLHNNSAKIKRKRRKESRIAQGNVSISTSIVQPLYNPITNAGQKRKAQLNKKITYILHLLSTPLKLKNHY